MHIRGLINFLERIARIRQPVQGNYIKNPEKERVFQIILCGKLLP